MTLKLVVFFTFTVKATDNIKGIIRKETFIVEGIRKQLSHCRAAHLLAVLVLIDLHSRENTYVISHQFKCKAPTFITRRKNL